MSQNEADITNERSHVTITPANGDTVEVSVGTVVEEEEEEASGEERLEDAEERRKQE